MIGRHFLFSRRPRREPPVPPEIETGRTRLLITGAMFVVAFSVIGLRLVDVALLSGGEDSGLVHRETVTAHRTVRANIVDRNGVLLATNLKTASLYADARLIADPATTASRLMAVLPDEDAATLRRRLASDRAFIWLRRHLTPRQQYAVNRLGVPGLDFRTEETRVYPQGRLMSNVLG